MNSHATFHYSIQYQEFRILNSHPFSVMNSYCEFIIMKSNPWIQQWILISEFIYLWFVMNWYKNSESINQKSYTWIHVLMNSYIHFIYEFICIWTHIIISYIWIHIMIVWIYMSMNSYIWIHIWSHINQSGDEGSYSLSALLNFGVFNGPKKNSNCTQFILGLGADKTFTTRWSGGRVQVWVQVQAPACHLAITSDGYSRRQSKV